MSTQSFYSRILVIRTSIPSWLDMASLNLRSNPSDNVRFDALPGLRQTRED